MLKKPGIRKRRFAVERLEARYLLAGEALESLDSHGQVDPSDFYISPHHYVAGTDLLLSEQSTGAPLDVAIDHLKKHAAEFGLAASDLEAFRVVDQYTSQHTGVTHIYMRQLHHGLEVLHADVNVNVTSDGRVLAAGSSFLPGLNSVAADNVAVAPVLPSLTATHALSILSAYFGWTLDDSVEPINVPSTSDDRSAVLPPAGVSLEPIPVELHYVPISGDRVELAWRLNVQTLDGQHWYDASVSAETGAVLYVSDWASHATYNVFPQPLSDPDDGSRAIVTDPHDTTASPLGWHDTNTIPGIGEFTDTRGNNVLAQEDVDFNDIGGVRPLGGAGLDFDFPLDLNNSPNTYQSAAITNAFYWTNVLHDIHFQYGFDEVAGNFQETNFSGTGVGGDAVRADVQDGSDLNNAQFFPTPDGIAPRMELFEWILPGVVTVQSPVALVGEYAAGLATFGPTVDATGITGDVVVSEPIDACSTLTNPTEVAGKIALIERGTCFFVDKVNRAQDAGALGVIVTNNVPGGVITMGGNDTGIVIPSLMLSLADGDLLRDAITAGSSVTTTLSGLGLRDSSLDNGIIIHEYGHGVSTRLTGGPANASSLDAIQSGGMGEGWSDWWALMFTQKASDLQTESSSVATYLTDQSADGPGIRRFPYSFDMAVNPLTFDDIDDAQADVACSPIGCAEVHEAGEVWASALWDLNWLMINGDGANIPAKGFDADLYDGTGGNNIALQLITDGLKLQPSNPTFLEGRDAILTADVALTGGANHLAIWTAFARRGMGFSASDGGDANATSVIEAFDVPDLFLRDAQWNGDGTAGNIGDGTSWGDPNNWSVDGSVDVLPSGVSPGDDVTLNPAPTVGNISLGSDRTINTLTFAADYVVQGNTLNIESGDIVVIPNVVATLDADLASGGVLTKKGDGVLNFTGSASDLIVDAGTLILASTATVENLTIHSGANAILNGSILGDLNNSGEFTLGGDVNGDGGLDAADIDLLYSQLSGTVPQVDPRFDLFVDQVIDQNDVNYLLNNVMRRQFGDADLDGDIDIRDLLVVVRHFDPLGDHLNDGWSMGDFDGNNTIDSHDFDLASANFDSLGDVLPSRLSDVSESLLPTTSTALFDSGVEIRSNRSATSLMPTAISFQKSPSRKANG